MRFLTLVVRGVGVVVEVDVSATVARGRGGGVLGEGGDGGDEGLDEVSEADEDRNVADEGDGGTTVDEVGGGPEVVVIVPLVLAEPSAAGDGAGEGAELDVEASGEVAAGLDGGGAGNGGGGGNDGGGGHGRGGGSSDNGGGRGAVSERVEGLGNEGLGLVVDDDDQGEGDHDRGESNTGEGKGVAGLAEEGGEAEADNDEGDGEIESEDPRVLAGVPLGVGSGSVPLNLGGEDETGRNSAEVAVGLLEVADLGPVEELRVGLEEGDVVAVVVEGKLVGHAGGGLSLYRVKRKEKEKG